MPIITIDSLTYPGVEVFASLTDAQLRSRVNAEKAVFIAESPKVIRVALSAGHSPLALMCEAKHISGDAADIVARCPDIPIYIGEREVLSSLTGYTLTRGVLCAMRRPAMRSALQICTNSHTAIRRVVLLHGVCDSTNVGAIFRSAAALGIDAVLLTPDSCDPLNRRAIRVSMGSVFLVPWATASEAEIECLREQGFRTVAMALTDKSVPLDSPKLKAEDKLIIVMGTEGNGLSATTIERADYAVRIPMENGVDSLNVASASAVAFWELCKH